MPAPLQNEVYVDQLATSILIANMPTDQDWVHTQVAAMVPVPFPSGFYASMPDDQFFRSAAKATAPDAPAPRIEYHVKPDNRYLCQTVRVATTISRETAEMYQTPFDATRTSSMLLANDLMLNKEIAFNRAYLAPGVWTGFRPNGIVQDFDCTQAYSKGQWDTASGNPILDIKYLMTYMRSRTSKMPNIFVVSRDVWSVLENSPVIVERIKYSQIGVLTQDLIAQVLGLTKIVIADAVLNSAQENQPKNMGFMARNCALLVYRTQAPAINEPSAMYDFTWTGLPGSNGLTGVVTSWFDPNIRSTIMEAACSYDFRVTASDFGIFLTNILSNPLV